MINDLTKKLCDSAVAKQIIVFLFEELQKNKHKKNIEAWKRNFIFLHGELDSQRKINWQSLEKKYSISIENKDNLFLLIYSLETYYSIVLRFIARKNLDSRDIESADINEILFGDYFISKSILNYSCHENYNWLEDIKTLRKILSPLCILFNKLSFKNLKGDFIKLIFKEIFPSKIRHSMGEFYTPDWIAKYIISNSIKGDSNLANKKFLDPTCGSGTFLVETINRFLPDDKSIFDRVFGIELNPLSALAAKTNIIILVQEYLSSYPEGYFIPIFNTDVMDASLYNINPDLLSDNENKKIKINHHEIEIDINNLNYLNLIDVYKSINLEGNSLRNLDCTQKKLFSTLSEPSLKDSLDAIISILAPFTLNEINYIIGNPPWVNWEYLPKEYKEKTSDLWRHYDLYDLRGIDSSFIKEDISCLITYTVIDRHLIEGGKIGFVIKQSVFKSSKQAKSFRRFSSRQANFNFKVSEVVDLTKLNVFSGVNARASLFFAEKGKETIYPVSYKEWMPVKKSSFGDQTDLSEVTKNTQILDHIAIPADKNDPKSGWVSFEPGLRAFIDAASGDSFYKARTGTFTGGANAAYWLEILDMKEDKVLITNITERAKNPIEKKERWVEKEFVFPLIKGNEIDMWNYKYSKYILFPHTKETKMKPVKIEELKKYQSTFKYFEEIKSILKNRKGFAGWERYILEDYYYSLQRIGEYTFSKYKVCWRYISKNFTTCVIEDPEDKFLGYKNLIPNEKIIYVGLDDKKAAYFLCGMLSSSFFSKLIEGFMVQTQIGPNILNKLNIPSFDNKNNQHCSISLICEQGHKNGKLDESLKKIDLIVEKILSDKT